MSDTRLKVIVTRRLPDAVELRLKELFDTELNPSDEAFSEAQLIDAVRRADVLVPTVTDAVNGKVISQTGEQFKMIA
ncbi:MAG: D-glycerate dehydrogenase, partial [Pseudomonadota bacterium]